MDKVALVILNYNGATWLRQFLPDVLRHADGATVWVADGASTDESTTLLRSEFPTVGLLELSGNYGYAGGYNVALAQIEAEYYVLLNSDVAVTPGWLGPLVALMDARPNVAACQPKIRSFHQPTHFEYAGAAGGYLDWLGYAFCRGRLFMTCEEDHGQYDDTRRVFWATGACLMVRASVFRQSGGFDADFFAHMEEIDWCWRVQRLGHEVWAVGDSTVYHVGGGTLANTSYYKLFLNYRNNLVMLAKNLPGARAWWLIFLRLLFDGLSGLRFAAIGEWRGVWTILRAHFAFYGQLPSVLRKRNALRSAQHATFPLFPRAVALQYFLFGKKRFSQL